MLYKYIEVLVSTTERPTITQKEYVDFFSFESFLTNPIYCEMDLEEVSHFHTRLTPPIQKNKTFNHVLHHDVKKRLFSDEGDVTAASCEVEERRSTK